MRKILFILLINTLFLGSCNSYKKPTSMAVADAVKPEKNEEGEWDLEVFDPRYNYFLNAVARPMSMYSETTLKNRNQMLVSEWNSYFYSGRYPNVVGSPIDYDPREAYGLKFEYKLYQVFAYVRWEYGLRMTGLSGVDASLR